MFDMGFVSDRCYLADEVYRVSFFSIIKEPQVRSIADHVRPDRQCLLFSATFKKKVEKLGLLHLFDRARG